MALAMLAALLLAGGALYWLLFADVGPAPIEDVAENLNRVGATGEMSGSFKNLIGLALLSLPLVLPLIWLVWLYNGIVDQEEQVYAAWAQVESHYQRRSDLIPNLVRMVERYLDHERGALLEITTERADALRPLATALEEIDAARREADAQTAGARPEAEAAAALERLAGAQAAVGRSLGNFFSVVESYPQLRSADQFLELQAQLEGSENRINLARVAFNRAVEDYNGAIRRLPGSLAARLGGFGRKAYFQAAEDAAAAAEIRFD